MEELWELYKHREVSLPKESAARVLDEVIMQIICEHSSLPEVLEAVGNGGYHRELFYRSLLVSCKNNDGRYNFDIFFWNKADNAKEFDAQLEKRLQKCVN